MVGCGLVLFLQNQTINDINNKTQIMAVIMPNILKSGKKPLEDKAELCSNKNLSSISAPLSNITSPPSDWEQYKTTLAEVERISGFKILNLIK